MSDGTEVKQVTPERKREYVEATRRMVAEVSNILISINPETSLFSDAPEEMKQIFKDNTDAMWKVIENAVKEHGLA